MSGPLAIVSRDGAVYVLDDASAADEPGRSVGRRVAENAAWPTFAPGGRGLAVVRLERDGEGPAASLVISSGTGPGTDRPVPGFTRRAFVAPRLPLYAMWSPSRDYVSFVAAEGDALGLFAWAPGPGSGGVVSLGGGMPIFHAWHPHGGGVAVHAGQQLSLVKGDGSDRVVLTREAGGFRAPAWSSDGRLLAWAESGGSGTRVRVHAAGDVVDLARFSGGVALSFRPGTADLAVAVAANPAAGVFDSLHVVTVDGSASARPLFRGPFVAHAWAPAGDRLATVVPRQTGDGRYAIEVRGADGAVVSVSEAFVPSTDTRMALGFFDQFSLSHPWWAPDGEGVVLCGYLGGDGVSASFGDAEGPYVLWWPARPREPFRRLAPGEFACFAPPIPAP